MARTTQPLEKARNRIAAVWFFGAFFPFIILVIQSIRGCYGDSVQKVWSWFVPTISPTLALILGVMGAMALSTNTDKRVVKGFFLQLSIGLSVVYLLVLTLTIVLEPASPVHGIELYQMSNYWLSPIQGLAVATITVLFTSQEKGGKASEPEPETAGD